MGGTGFSLRDILSTKILCMGGTGFSLVSPPIKNTDWSGVDSLVFFLYFSRHEVRKPLKQQEACTTPLKSSGRNYDIQHLKDD